MTLNRRVDQLEKRLGATDDKPYVSVLVDEGEDEERAIQEALEKEGHTKDTCNIIVRRIVEPKPRQD